MHFVLPRRPDSRPDKLRIRLSSDAAIAGCVFVAASIAYVATLAPTVTWGDDATLQLSAVQGQLRSSAGSHPAWVLLAHWLSRLPVPEPAFGVNLASALPAAAALALLYLTLRQLGVPAGASLAGVVALGVSHTFWAHAVRAEVYALTMASQTLVILAALAWHCRGQRRWLALMGVGAGMALSTHMLSALMLPAVGWLLFDTRRRLHLPDVSALAISTLASLLPLGYLVWRDSRSLGLSVAQALRWALLTFQGYDFSAQMMKFSVGGLLSDTAQWLGYLVYQFAGIGILLGALGVISVRKRLPVSLAIFVALLYVVPALFAFSYRVGDRYVFFLPSYVAFSIWVAVGAWELPRRLQAFKGRRLAGVAWTALLLALIIVPVGLYRLTPYVMQRFGIQLRDSRYVPGPEGRYFVLWPAKTGYRDARVFAEAALDDAPQDALLLADPILAAPMIYLQQVEGRRQDVAVKYCCWDIDNALAANQRRPIALADITPSIYPTERLRREYAIVSQGTLFLLENIDSGASKVQGAEEIP